MLIPLSSDSVAQCFPDTWHPNGVYAGVVRNNELFGIVGLLIVTKKLVIMSYLTLPDKRSKGYLTRSNIQHVLDWVKGLGFNAMFWTENKKFSRILQRFGARLVWQVPGLDLLMKET
jgi:Acetyltransferase (GNAT) family